MLWQLPTVVTVCQQPSFQLEPLHLYTPAEESRVASSNACCRASVRVSGIQILGFGNCSLTLRVAESGHSSEFVEIGVAGHILDDDVVIGIFNGLGFVRLNVAFGRDG